MRRFIVGYVYFDGKNMSYGRFINQSERLPTMQELETIAFGKMNTRPSENYKPDIVNVISICEVSAEDLDDLFPNA